MPNGLILGIESSCDETSAAVVRGGHEVLANVVASQLVHADYGGVVPELASREHLRAIVPITREALRRAGIRYADLDAIAVTAGPGLAGALLVGITFAKSLAFGLGKPLIAVNHLEGHIHAVLMQTANPGAPIAASCDVRDPKTPTPTIPLLTLVVSGGHTHLYLANRTAAQTWTYRNVGKTLDDAAGEAFDKAAKLLGLPYPGGPWIDALAHFGDPAAVPFTLAQIKSKASGNTAPKLARERAALKATGFSTYNNAETEPGTFATEGGSEKRFDLSFSGLKTALRRHVELHALHPAIAMRMEALRATGLDRANPRDPATLASALTHFDQPTLNLIASFQYTIVKNLTRATFAAAEHFHAGAVLVSGGVSANSALRASMTTLAAQHNLPIAFPTIALSTDNAAMIAAAAWPKFLAQNFADDTLEPTPQLRLG